MLKNFQSEKDLNSALLGSSPLLQGNLLNLSQPVSQLPWERRNSRLRQGCYENEIKQFMQMLNTILTGTVALIRIVIPFH